METKQDHPFSVAGRMHAYLAAKTAWINAGLRDNGRALKALETALEAFEKSIPTDADTFYLRDAAGRFWCIEYGRHRAGGRGWPDSSHPTISDLLDLIIDDTHAQRAHDLNIPA